jgi:PAS domain S-box-containing protein
MNNFLERLSSSDGFMPHGMCYLWQPDVLGLHVVSDALISIAYFSIPFTLLYFVRRRRDLEFNWMFVCFAVFIVACGMTHLMEIWVIWHATYWLSGGVKAVTALASVPTAILLAKLIPDALRLPSPSALQRVNADLQREIAERQRAEGNVHRLNDALERRVLERTSELEAVNHRLLREIRDRERAERDLRDSEGRVRAALETLRSSRQLLQAISDNAPAVIYVKDIDGRYLMVNRRYLEVFHLASDAVMGKTDHEIFSREAADLYRAMDERVAVGGIPLTEEEVVLLDDGPHTYVSVKCPLWGDSGKPYAVCGISTDITDLKRAEVKLRSQLSRLELLNRIARAVGERLDLPSILQVVIRSLVEDLPIDFGCVFLYEAGSEILTVARIGARPGAFALESVLTENSCIPIDQNGLSRCVRGELVYEPDISNSSFPFPQRLAQSGLRSLVFAPLRVESSVFGVLVAARREPQSFSSGDCEFLRQLSEQVALAAHQAQLYDALQRAYDDLRQTQHAMMQQERLRAFGQMASGIAHDINNALSPAALYIASMLERDASLSTQARAYLAIVQRAVEDVAHTVARMREFYRRRETQIALERVQVNETIQHVIELTRARWSDIPQERGIVIRVETELAPALPTLMGAENEVRDALTNLVLNAVDAMPEGGTLTIRSRAVSNVVEGNPGTLVATRVCIEVCDTGIGMSEETRSHCMEPFFTTKGERGTGLGLAMVFGMIERHRGELEILSETGKGTTMRLIFPVLTSSGSISNSSTAATPSRRLHILAVDDDPQVLRSLRDVLEGDGHHVTVADGGQAGIDAFVASEARGERFSVVITDLGMPHVDGRRVALAIKNASSATPVIMLTGWGERLVATSEVPQHVDRILSKPPKLSELREALARCCESTDP